jgi:ketosteroid isomerase-like protein
MGLSENKQVVKTFLDAGARGDIDTCFEQLAEDVAWTNIGHTKYSGTYTGKADLTTRLIGPLFGQLAGGIRSTIHSVIAEGERVVVQSTGEATTRSGRAYNNTYCQVFTIRDGKIGAVTEYLDTALVNDVFGE